MVTADPAVNTDHGGGGGREITACVYIHWPVLLGIDSSNVHIDYLARPDGRLNSLQ